MRRVYLIINLIILGVLNGLSQNFYLHQYKVEDGLPTNIVKATAQDSLGYYWIATDEGLVKYNGLEFTKYLSNFRSNYIKGFITTRDGRLMMYGDMDFVEILNNEDTVIFKTVASVSDVPDDKHISYPKLIFEDQNNSLWISESQAVVRLKNGELNRYTFEPKDRTTVFLRSFHFFEDNSGVLHTVAYNGSVYRHLVDEDRFEPTDTRFPGDVEVILREGDRLLIGSIQGIYSSTLKPDGGITEPVILSEINGVSFIKKISENQYFIATRTQDQYYTEDNFESFEKLDLQINNVNHLHPTPSGELWMAGNDGWTMLRENLFQKVNPDLNNFIEDITQDPRSLDIYYADQTDLFRYEFATAKNEKLFTLPDGYFQSLEATENGLWVANAFSLYFLQNDQLTKTHDFAETSRFITRLNKGFNGDIWLTIPGIDSIYTIRADRRIEGFGVPMMPGNMINKVVPMENGIYVLASDVDDYLFFKPYASDTFENRSIPFETVNVTNFKAYDASFNQGKIWIATSAGLLCIEENTARIIDLGPEYRNLPMRSIESFTETQILLSCGLGLLRYDLIQNSVDQFSESNGLPARTVTHRGIFVDADHSLWIGTSKGLAMSDDLLKSTGETPKPRIINIEIDGVKTKNHGSVTMEFESYLTITISSIVHPASDIIYQYQIAGDNSWKSTSNRLSFNDLQTGDHEVLIRSKKFGPYEWSEVASVFVTVNPPYWQKTRFYLLLVIGLLVLSVLIYMFLNFRNNLRNKKLQFLVNLKTRELKKVNNHLSELNEEKDNLIGIVAHDLKSPLAQIYSLASLMDDDSKLEGLSKDSVKMMKDISMRQSEMISRILDVRRIDDMNQQIEKVELDLSAILRNICGNMEVIALGKEIQLETNIEDDIYVMGDESMVSQCIENILSNAIKFSPYEKKVYVKLHIIGSLASCEIQDEGPGITDEDKTKLFGRFQRLSARPTGNESSTGIGLYAVKKFMDQLGGEVSVESEPDKGACFVLTFEMAESSDKP